MLMRLILALAQVICKYLIMHWVIFWQTDEDRCSLTMIKATVVQLSLCMFADFLL